MSQTFMRTLFTVFALSPFLLGSLASAQDSPPVRVRGTIDHLESEALIVKARDGAELKITLAPNAVVLATVKASLADIKPGTFVGVAAMPQPDGSQRALEVHIFPEAMRGTGEGHFAWDLHPRSTMTNGRVEQPVATADGQILTLKYKHGEKRIIVPPDVPIVFYQPTDKSELKAGARIFIAAAKKQADGTLQAPRIGVGRNAPPPM